jgi:hypothetical protein
MGAQRGAYIRTESENQEFRYSYMTPYPCEGRLEYLHRIPASRKRRRKGNPVPRGMTGPPCTWGT